MKYLYICMFDQYTAWYEEPSVGGLEKTLSDLIAADPDFGECMCLA
jgi:hypothetical protein